MKSNIQVPKHQVINAQLPNHGSTYTVISHKDIIDTTKIMLANSGFKITEEIYRGNTNCEIAQGIYHIKPFSTNDPTIENETELGMMFAWTNSYDKSLRFQCSIGAYVYACSNGMICGSVNYARKHRGSADQDIKTQISSQIKDAERVYKTILKDRDSLRNTELSLERQAELLGVMFMHEDLVSPRQLSAIKDEMSKPSYNYKDYDPENAWSFYNHVTHSYKTIHPRQWMKQSLLFHKFMMANVAMNSQTNTQVDTINHSVDGIEEDIDLFSNPTNQVDMPDFVDDPTEFEL